MATFDEAVMYWPNKPCKRAHGSPYYKSGKACVECSRLSRRKWRVANAKHELVKAKEWRDRNREWLRERERKRYHEEPSKKERDRKWKQENRHIFTALQVKREAAKNKRTPTWANLTKIREFYREARRLTQETGVPHHVDHIVPLQGREVCGLHVENNLRVIPATENMSKHNKLILC